MSLFCEICACPACPVERAPPGFSTGMECVAYSFGAICGLKSGQSLPNSTRANLCNLRNLWIDLKNGFIQKYHLG